MEFRDFPGYLIVPEGGSISGGAGHYNIAIALKPFSCDDEEVHQTLTIEDIPLLASDISGLAHHRFEFPANPTSGYVETSIYIGRVHHPIDVTSIGFGAIEGNRINVGFTLHFAFEYEGEYKNWDTKLVVPLEISIHPTKSPRPPKAISATPGPAACA